MNKRIWELDAFRGICIIGVVIVHFVYDLVELYGVIQWEYPTWFTMIKGCGFLFLILSGICVTLGRNSIRRGALVFAFGMVITAVTYGMYYFGFAGNGVIIYFGVLHCLGICMLLWPVFKKLPWWALVILGGALVILGFRVDGMTAENRFLMPLGIVWSGFKSSDYFPLLPNLGYFLLGAAVGKTVYAKKQTLLPKIDGTKGFFGFLCACGRQSLWIYLLHQPIVSGICMVLLALK